MKQLSGLDAGFLYMETPTTFGHINGVSIYQQPTDGTAPIDLVRARIAARLPDLEPFRRRLVDVPFGLDHPWWIDDPAFDLDFHVRHVAIPGPGGPAELAEFVGQTISRPLDRARPLWEAYVIEGLADDRWALLLKIHHATIDGAAGAEMLTMLLDVEPSPADDLEAAVGALAADRWTPVPTSTEMLVRTASTFAARPERFLRAQQRVLRDTAKVVTQQGPAVFGAAASATIAAWTRAMPGSSAGRSRRPAAPTGVAPPTPFNKSITPHRSFSYRTTELAEIKEIKQAFGATVNDVVMAICAGALRSYLLAHDSPVDQPLVAMVPVSIRGADEPEKWTNRVSTIFAELPVHLDDGAARLGYVHEAMAQAKSGFDLVPADALQDFTRFSPPAVFTEAAALAARLKLGDRMRPSVNLVISNVPGPRHALFMGPARLEHYYPVSSVAEGMGLNITVQSYQDKLDFGLVACRELAPDLDDLTDLVIAEQASLLAMARGE